jgi:hypothetical protein
MVARTASQVLHLELAVSVRIPATAAKILLLLAGKALVFPTPQIAVARPLRRAVPEHRQAPHLRPLLRQAAQAFEMRQIAGVAHKLFGGYA